MYDTDLAMIVPKRLFDEATARSVASGAVRPVPSHLKLVKPAPRSDIRISVHSDLAEVEQEWRAFEKSAICTVFQTFGWLSKWHTHAGAPAGIRPAIVMGRDAGGELLFLFPLSVETRGAVRRLSWLGHALCDYNAPLLAPAFLGDLDPESFRALFQDAVAHIRASSKSRIDLVDLDKMPEHVAQAKNPFTALDVLPHPSGAHIATLDTDWEKFYAAKRSSATRKKERKKLRQLGEYGAVALDDAVTPEGRNAVMNLLIGQKSHWFARMGVNDIFAKPGNREFFMAVATDPDMAGIVHVTRLKVGETAAATSMGLRFGGGYLLVLSSYLDAEMSRLGPGRAHLYELMRYAIGQSYGWFDFTVGDEPYKRDWSDKVVKMYDYLQPVSLRGRIAVLALLAFRKTKRFIKGTPVLWRAYSNLRTLKGRLRGGKAKDTGESEASGD